MDSNETSFENLPKAVAHLVNEVAEIKALVEKRYFSKTYSYRDS